MNTHRCPRCGKTIPNWQPIHFRCLYARGKYIFLSFIFIPLILFMGWKGDKLVSAISGGFEHNGQFTTTLVLFEATTTLQKSQTIKPTGISGGTLEPVATKTRTPQIYPSKTLKPTIKIKPSSTLSIRRTRTPRSTTTPTFDWSTCHADYVSRLKVGDKAYVSKNPPLANNVRQRPYTDATILGKIQPGEEITIIDGPSCSNRWVWWKVTAKNNRLTGWTAEGDSNAYWLIPK
jgi:hypothetical protein